MNISAKVDYGVRALLALTEGPELMTTETIAQAQGLPAKYLGLIMADLRRAGFVIAKRGGSQRGYRLSRPASKIAVVDVMEALDGPLAAVRGELPETTHYTGIAQHLPDVWAFLGSNLHAVLEGISLDDVVEGRLPIPEKMYHSIPQGGNHA